MEPTGICAVGDSFQIALVGFLLSFGGDDLCDGCSDSLRGNYQLWRHNLCGSHTHNIRCWARLLLGRNSCSFPNSSRRGRIRPIAQEDLGKREVTCLTLVLFLFSSINQIEENQE